MRVPLRWPLPVTGGGRRGTAPSISASSEHHPTGVYLNREDH